MIPHPSSFKLEVGTGEAGEPFRDTTPRVIRALGLGSRSINPETENRRWILPTLQAERLRRLEVRTTVPPAVM